MYYIEAYIRERINFIQGRELILIQQNKRIWKRSKEALQTNHEFDEQ